MREIRFQSSNEKKEGRLYSATARTTRNSTVCVAELMKEVREGEWNQGPQKCLFVAPFALRIDDTLNRIQTESRSTMR